MLKNKKELEFNNEKSEWNYDGKEVVSDNSDELEDEEEVKQEVKIQESKLAKDIRNILFSII